MSLVHYQILSISYKKTLSIAKKCVWIPERWIQVGLLYFIKHRLYKLMIGCVWEIDEVLSEARWVAWRSWVVRSFIYWLLWTLNLSAYISVLQYKPSLNTVETGNDDPHVSCHQPEAFWGIKILLFTAWEKRKIMWNEDRYKLL